MNWVKCEMRRIEMKIKWVACYQRPQLADVFLSSHSTFTHFLIKLFIYLLSSFFLFFYAFSRFVPVYTRKTFFLDFHSAWHQRVVPVTRIISTVPMQPRTMQYQTILYHLFRVSIDLTLLFITLHTNVYIDIALQQCYVLVLKDKIFRDKIFQ